MKARNFLILCFAFFVAACDDTTDSIGINMLPDSDKNVEGRASVFDVTTHSVNAGRIYAKTNVGYVGNFKDETFGSFNAGFLAEMNCPKGLSFPKVYQAYNADGEPVDKDSPDAAYAEGKMLKGPNKGELGNIYLTEMYIWFADFYGDPYSTSRLSVYALNKKLDPSQVYYTDINPEDYYDSDNGLLASAAYTPDDLTIDPEKKTSDDFMPKVYLKLDNKDLGWEILEASREEEAKEDGDLSKRFENILKGIYVKHDFGSGNVLYISQVQLNVVYEAYAIGENGLKLKKKDSDVDSIVYNYRTFNTTREKYQANQLVNDQSVIDELIKRVDCTFLKTPAGIFTEGILPLNNIKAKLLDESGERKADILNVAELTVPAYRKQEESSEAYSMDVPKEILLVRAKDKDRFFEENNLPDGVTSYVAEHDKSQNHYKFPNIVKLIDACINARAEALESIEKDGEVIVPVYHKGSGTTDVVAHSIEEWETLTQWDKVYLIPVSAIYEVNSGAYGQQERRLVKVQHDLKPTYVRLKGGLAGESDADYRLNINIISTHFNANK